MEISEEISKTFLNVMARNSEGLWLVPVPTSAGKSTAVAMAIANFISRHQYNEEDCRINFGIRALNENFAALRKNS